MNVCSKSCWWRNNPVLIHVLIFSFVFHEFVFDWHQFVKSLCLADCFSVKVTKVCRSVGVRDSLYLVAWLQSYVLHKVNSSIHIFFSPSPTRLFLQNTPPNPSSLISSSLACSHAPNLINADHVFSEGKTAASNDAFHHKWMFKPISSSLEEHYKPPHSTPPHTPPTELAKRWWTHFVQMCPMFLLKLHAQRTVKPIMIKAQQAKMLTRDQIC